MAASRCFEFSFESMVRGYHVYQEEWDATIGEILQCQRETGNRYDPYAVATLSDRRVVGQVPRKISPFVLYLFDEEALYRVW